MRHSMQRSIAQQLDQEGNYLQPLQAAREKFTWIYENHHPEPLESAVQKELARILDHAGRELE
jgi:hypothetical protein